MIKTRKFLLPGLAVVAAVVFFSDPSSVTLRFFAKMAILVLGLATIMSLLITRFFGPDTNRKVWGNIILGGVSVCVTLLIAEFIVRYSYRDVSTTADNSSYFARRWYTMHPPSLNQLGFREKEVSRTKSPDVYRIAIIGDSFAYGQGILTNERFSDLLQRKLDPSGNRYEVLNFGQPGAETDDHLQIFEEIVVNLSPDFVLLQWFVNDVELSGSGRPKVIRLIPSDFLNSWFSVHSALFYLVDSQWKSLQGRLGLTESYVANMARRFENPNSEESLAASTALEQLLSRLKEQNIPAGMILFPMIADVNGDVEGYPLGFLMDRVLAACIQHGIPCIDLRPNLADTLTTPDLWASRLDNHPGPAANKVAAEAIMMRVGNLWLNDKR